MVVNVLLAAAGGAIGAAARYGLGVALGGAGAGFPVATLVINLAGCAAIGLLAGALARLGGPTGPVWIFAAVGVLGGFTTFSAFSLEVVNMLRAGHALGAVLYVAASNVGGIALALLGAALTMGSARSAA